MLRIHCHAAAVTSIKRTPALIRAIALRFVIAAVANIDGISSILPQPVYDEAHAWLTQQESAVKCDLLRASKAFQTASGSANPPLIAQEPSHEGL
jgi:hypothetical protein